MHVPESDRLLRYILHFYIKLAHDLKRSILSRNEVDEKSCSAGDVDGMSVCVLKRGLIIIMRFEERGLNRTFIGSIVERRNNMFEHLVRHLNWSTTLEWSRDVVGREGSGRSTWMR